MTDTRVRAALEIANTQASRVTPRYDAGDESITEATVFSRVQGCARGGPSR
jgi:hypothetical protein